MKVVVLLFVIAAMALVDSLPLTSSEENTVQRTPGNSRSYIISTICDIQFLSKEYGNQYDENPTLNPDYVLCRIDEEFGKGTSRNLVIVSFVILALILIACLRYFCCKD